MQNRAPRRRTTAIGLSALCAGWFPASHVWAFDDASCAKIETTTQTAPIQLLPNETIDAARTRGIDKVSEQAVYQVVGYDIESSRADEQRAVNENATSEYQDKARHAYKGLVRVTLIDVSKHGFDGHEQLDMTANVTVCVPKTDEEMKADRERREANLRVAREKAEAEQAASREKNEAERSASLEKAIRDKQPPRVVDPEKAAWFDPNSGEAQHWYWASPNQIYTFFDKDGFDPATGDLLKRVDRQFSKDWRASLAKKRIDASNLAVAQQKEEMRKQAEENAGRQLAAQRAQQASRASDLCDTNAANPNDPKKPNAVAGVSWDALKATADLAVQSCQSAVQNAPEEPRYRYQLARAYSVNDPKRALPLFRQLCREHYPAAYDNFGWALLDRRVGLNDLTGATRSFEAGVKAGDSDAMTSLASLMVKGSVDPNFSEEPLQLFRRAASLGNQDAIAAVARLEAEQAQENALRAQQREQDRRQATQQEQAGRMFMGILGGAMANVGRR